MEYTYVKRKDNSKEFGPIKCFSQSSIKKLKEKIKNVWEIPIDCQKLYYKGNELLDADNFSNIKFPHVLNQIDLYNLNKLKVEIYTKDRLLFKCYLKSCDTILNLKLVISKDITIPVDKINILHSNKIIGDMELIENFLPNLSFEIEFLSITDKIKINLIEEGRKEIIYVNKLSLTDDIFNQLKKDYIFRLKYNNKYIFPGKFLFEYNLSDNDTIDIIKYKSKAIELTFKLRINHEKKVFVYPEEPLCVLVGLLNINNKNIRLVYEGVTYPVYSIFTFEEIQIENCAKINLISPSRCG